MVTVWESDVGVTLTHEDGLTFTSSSDVWYLD